MSKIIKVNTDQGRCRKRLINYDRFVNMRPGDWDHEAEIDGKSFRVFSGNGGTVASHRAARTSAVLAIECVDDDTTVVMGARVPVSHGSSSFAAFASLYQSWGFYWAIDVCWLWNGRSRERGEEAWKALVRAYGITVARAEAAAK